MKTARTGTRSLGAILVDSGKLSVADAERILHLQKEQKLRFGDAAVKLGVLTQLDIDQALSNQFAYDYLTPGDAQISESVIAAFKPFHPLVEQLRALRSQLMLRWFDAESGNKTLAIVSPGRGEGRSLIAANLAVVCSQLGERTLLIDGDLRRPIQHDYFKLDNKVGLSSVLAGLGELPEALVRIPALLNLSVLPAGAIPPNPQELLSRGVFVTLLEAMHDAYDVIIVDTPPGAESADAQTIAARTGGALAVARNGLTSLPALQALVSSLEQSGVAMVGAVLDNN